MTALALVGRAFDLADALQLLRIEDVVEGQDQVAVGHERGGRKWHPIDEADETRLAVNREKRLREPLTLPALDGEEDARDERAAMDDLARGEDHAATVARQRCVFGKE